MARSFRVLACLCVALAAGCGARDSQTAAPAAAPAASTEPGSATPAAPDATVIDKVRVETLTTGLRHPWGLAFLPDGGMLVTERVGTLRRLGADGATQAEIAGVPAVVAEGQGGLLDVALSPFFATDQQIYLSYAEPGEGRDAGTAVAVARLVDDSLVDLKVIFRQTPKVPTRHHFGSRFAFDELNRLFVTLGDRGLRPTAQDLGSHMGTVVRLRLDGRVPDDNPFVGQEGALPEIWSYGHRNQQGAAIHPTTGELWTHEHGPRGGDEINIPRAGVNHGWPIVTHGIDYSGQPISEAVGKEQEGMQPPHHVWEVSPGVSGMAFYTHERYPQWQDSLFVGALAQRVLIRLSLDGDRVVGEQRLLGNLQARIRDVRVGPDGAVYLLTDDIDGRLLRLTPDAG